MINLGKFLFQQILDARNEANGRKELILPNLIYGIPVSQGFTKHDTEDYEAQSLPIKVDPRLLNGPHIDDLGAPEDSRCRTRSSYDGATRQSSILQSGDHHPQPRMMMFNNIYDKNLLMLRPPRDEQHLMRVGRRECVSCLFNDPSYPSSLTNLSLSLSWPHPRKDHHQMMHYLPRQYIYIRPYPPPPPLCMFSGEDEIFAPPGGSWNIYPKFVAKEINLTPQSSGIGPNYNGVPIYEKGEEYCSCALTLGRGSNGKGKEPINVSSMVGSSNNVVVPPSFFSLQLPSGDGGWGFTDDNFDDINNVPGKNKRKRQYTHRKMSVYSFPTNVKNLLSTGIFEGVPVKYVSWFRGVS
nr:uncharacterized protein LOC109187050 [Ipomoea trifida]